jgi:hypothetical protein
MQLNYRTPRTMLGMVLSNEPGRRPERIARLFEAAVYSPSGGVASASTAFLIPMIRWSILTFRFLDT